MENNNIETDNEIRSYFDELLLKSGISVAEEKKEKMLEFLELMYEKNKIMNLTAIRDKKGMTEKHFIDSLFLTEVIQKEEKNTGVYDTFLKSKRKIFASETES